MECISFFLKRVIGFLKKKSEQMSMKKEINLIQSIWDKYGWIMFMLVFWAFYGLMIIHEAYYQEIYISPDSTGYLGEAQALVHGYGMNDQGLSGGNGWFAKWPVGYPAMIAFFMFLMPGHSSYLASKMLTIVVIGIMLLIFSVKYRENAWIIAMTLLNPGMIIDYYYTWSEVPFIPFLIVFSLSITYILCHEKPKVCQYFWLFISVIGAFSVRYFGIFVLLYLGVLWGVLFLVFCFGYKMKNTDLKNKLIAIFAIGFVASILESAYLYLNYKMCGLATGVERTRFTDDITELTNNLFGALTMEVSNLLQQQSHPIFRYISGGSQRVLAVFCIVGIIGLLFNRKKIDDVMAFLSVGVFYYVIFIFVRYHSSMDGFSYRFFAPASVLISIALAICLKDYLIKKNINANNMMTVLFGFVLLSAVSLYQIDRGRTDGAYKQFYESVNVDFYGVPSKSLVLCVNVEGYNYDYRWSVVRPDVAVAEFIEGESMDDLLKRAESYDYLCVKKNIYNDVIKPQGMCSDSVRDFLEERLQNEYGENQYIVIGLKH